ncbi:phage regulatory protein, Rha family [Ligilactobacillus salivarius ACS-116-V-Col5a]|uniref:Rha family transcriptional regulator n=1 Tax=Ligilactobacillus salivarius TaxID=1624 RepID=UPI0001DD2D36|nr:phage regulatory protein [Ligilactobacillus salivarius]EFK80438.1 phage regulatory protein, Rha family [Ligilactobacillus salivarius ACS-116-V-Col5a]
MNNLVIMHERQAVTTSLILAEAFEKEHSKVIRTIETKLKMTEAKNGLSEMFAESTYTDRSGKQNKMYYLNHDGFTFIAMGFTGRKVDEFKLKYIDAFNKMEEQIRNQSLQVLNQSTDDLKRANLLYKIANLTSDEELKEESLKSSYELVTGKLIHQKKTDYQKLYEAVTERYGDSVEDNLKGAIRFIRVWKG